MIVTHEICFTNNFDLFVHATKLKLFDLYLLFCLEHIIYRIDIKTFQTSITYAIRILIKKYWYNDVR